MEFYIIRCRLCEPFRSWTEAGTRKPLSEGEKDGHTKVFSLAGHGGYCSREMRHVAAVLMLFIRVVRRISDAAKQSVRLRGRR